MKQLPLTRAYIRGILFAAIVFLTGCINILPPVRMGAEMNEAKELAKLMRSLMPEAKELVLEERNIANELKITLDQLGQMPPEVFRQKFHSYVDRLVALRNKRQQIKATVGQGSWQSPMVFAVQHNGLVILQDQIVRTERWIQFARNVQLRADLGQQKDYPDLPALSHALDGFLAQTVEAPLLEEVHTLQAEFRFGEAEIGF